MALVQSDHEPKQKQKQDQDQDQEQNADINSKQDSMQETGCCAKVWAFLWKEGVVCGVHLKPGISRWTYLTYLLFLIGIFGVFTYLDIMLIFVLKHPQYYNIKESEAVAYVGNLIFFRSITRIVGDPIAGTLHDLISRKWIVVIGTLLTAPCFIVVPHCGSVYPFLLLVMYQSSHERL